MFKQLKETRNFKGLIIFLIATVFVLSGIGCKEGDREAIEKAKNVTLEYWTVQANVPALNTLVAAYKIEHPNVSIKISVIPEEKYRSTLIEAWAEDKGPDIFSINSLWLKDYIDFIQPMPKSTNLPYRTIVGTVKKEEKWILRPRIAYTPQKFATAFVPQVVTDALKDGQVYGLPLSFDSLALYYNRDIFNINNIIAPPDTWVPFTEIVKKITLLDQNDTLVQSAVAMGTAYNVDYSVDIASLIMMQNGTRMTDFNSDVVIFDQPVIRDGQKVEPAAQALLFYTDFANFAKEAYTWNNNFDSSREAFIKGETAMYFGYASDRDYIRSRAKGLNFEITYFPQIDGSQLKVNFARYWLETVSKKSTKQEWAWDFLLFATGEKNVMKYLNKAKLPTAQKSLLENQIETTPELEPFISQALTAQSWYRGEQPEVAYELFRQMIAEINGGLRTNLSKYFATVVAKINQTL